MADLNDLETQLQETTIDVPIVYPGTNDPYGLVFHVVSAENERVRKVVRSITDRRLKLVARGKNFTSEDLERNEIELLAAAVVGWDWTDDKNGQPGTFKGEQPKFSPKALRELLALPVIREQLSSVVQDTERFFQN